MTNLFFNLKETPFAETPDTRFYFKASGQSTALDRLLQCLESGQGFAMLTGEVGTGKTLLSRKLLKASEKSAESALLLFPNLEGRDLLATVASEFGLAPKKSASVKVLLDLLTEFLIKNASQGKSSILVIDECQQMSVNALETVRLISNIEQESKKLIQILLVGQPELKARLQSPESRQMNQRISTRLELSGFSKDEVGRYIKHRIEVAGGTNFIHFEESAIETIYQLSNGLPRLINLQCQLAIEYATEKQIRIIKKRDLIVALEKANVLERYRVFPFGKEEKLVQT